MSINQTKTQLAEAIELYDKLNRELANKHDLYKFTEEEWQAHIRSLGLDTAKLIQTSRMLDDDHLIHVIRQKEKKLVRHKRWAKRHKKRLQENRKQRLRRNEKWIKDIQWTVTVTPSYIATQEKKSTENKNGQEDKVDKAQQAKSKAKELSRILTKLKQLRDLRRKKLESKGHFYAEDGDQFYNQIKQWHDHADTVAPSDMEDHVHTQERKKLVIDKKDKWNTMVIDEKAYGYWTSSDQSLKELVRNRTRWDQYISYDSLDTSLLHKVPPTFVSPAPPANSIWASYLS